MYGNLEGIMRVTSNALGSLASRCETALFHTLTVTFSFFFLTASSIVMIYYQQQTKLIATYE